jgi:hypothetical protein
VQEERLIELAADSTISLAKVRAKIEQTALQKEAVKKQLQLTTDRVKYDTGKGLAHRELVNEPKTLKRN